MAVAVLLVPVAEDVWVLELEAVPDDVAVRELAPELDEVAVFVKGVADDELVRVAEDVAGRAETVPVPVLVAV